MHSNNLGFIYYFEYSIINIDLENNINIYEYRIKKYLQSSFSVSSEYRLQSYRAPCECGYLLTATSLHVCRCVSRFRVPSRLPLLSCYVDSSWIGQSVPIVQQVCTHHELTLPHLSLIPHLPYMSLCPLLIVSRLSCLCTYCHSPVYLSPSAADLNAR